jgi:sugar lactone lactonase YvrE
MKAQLWRTLSIAAGVVLVLALLPLQLSYSQGSGRTFAETGKTVTGQFLAYWDAHGGLAQQGYPISDEMQEVSATDGKTYTVQYFERAVFEAHPEQQDPQFQVLLSLLGVAYYNQKYPSGAPGQTPNNEAGALLLPETGKRLGGRFKQYWEQHGGLMQQGYPISDEFTEVSTLDGKPYRVQYFQRAVFQYHPENAGTAYEVLLAQLGTYQYQAQYPPGAPPPATAQPTGPPTVEPAPPPAGTVTFVWRSTGDPGTPLRAPWSLTLAGNGHLLVLDKDNYRIVELTLDGQFVRAWGQLGTGEGQFMFGESGAGLAVDPQGNIYATDVTRIEKFDRNGQFLRQWSLPGASGGQPNPPGAIAVDSQGNIYVVDLYNQRLQKFDGNGRWLAQFGGEYLKDPITVGGLGVDNQDNVYVALYGACRVVKFDPSGQFLAQWGSAGPGPGQFNRPADVAVDSQGNVYVTEGTDTGGGNRRIDKFDSAGRVLAAWGTPGSGPGAVKWPVGIVVDRDGNVYVADGLDNSVKKYEQHP